MDEVIKELAGYLKLAVRGSLIESKHVATRDLESSIDCPTSKAGNVYTITGVALYYAKWVESGRRRGTKGVPIDTLIDWLHVKRMSTGNAKKDRSKAFAIQRSIKRKGIKPTRFIQKALTANGGKVDRMLTGIVSKRIDDTMDKLFKMT